MCILGDDAGGFGSSGFTVQWIYVGIVAYLYLYASTATPQIVAHSTRAAHSGPRTRAEAKGDTQKEARTEHCKNRRGSRVQRV